MHEVTDDLSEVADLNPNLLEEVISEPSPNDHDCLWLYYGWEDIHGKS